MGAPGDATAVAARGMSRDDLREALRHVLWLGGTPCSGKSSVARYLVATHPPHYYHYDRHERAHIARRDPAQHPALHAYEALSNDERWVSRPVGTMVAATTAAWLERFTMVVDDLLALPHTMPILAEGPGLLPEAVAPLLSSPRQAIWLVPTEAFKRATQPSRGGAPMNLTSDPARAYENLIALDLQLVREVKARASDLGLAVIENDGTRSVETIARTIAGHFGLVSAG